MFRLYIYYGAYIWGIPLTKFFLISKLISKNKAQNHFQRFLIRQTEIGINFLLRKDIYRQIFKNLKKKKTKIVQKSIKKCDQIFEREKNSKMEIS